MFDSIKMFYFYSLIGLVSQKNEVNIMVKNAVDVIYGGLSYWLYGFGFSFGIAKGTNAFCGVGETNHVASKLH